MGIAWVTRIKTKEGHRAQPAKHMLRSNAHQTRSRYLKKRRERRPVLLIDLHYGMQYVRERSWRFDVTFLLFTQGGTKLFFSLHSSGGSRVRCKGLLDHCLVSIATAISFT
jgi:hypothetical protein